MYTAVRRLIVFQPFTADASIFGIRPALDECLLTICDICGAVIKPQALKSHIGESLCIRQPGIYQERLGVCCRRLSVCCGRLCVCYERLYVCCFVVCYSIASRYVY